jgi:type IV pilus assembly protein PilY1
MKTLISRFGLLLTLAGALANPWPAAAQHVSQDIDLYAGVNGGTAAPNVLFFLDNTSNWSDASNKWTKVSVTAKCNLLYTGTKLTTCLSYVTQIFGTATDLLQGQIELRALKLVLNETVCNPASGSTALNLNAGIMMFNKSTLGTADGSQYTSGYIRQRIANLDATRCTALLADLDLIDTKIQDTDYKTSSSATYATAMLDAFKYFGGYTNPAGAPTNASSTGTAGTPTDSTHFGPVRYSDVNPLEDPLAFVDSARTTYKSPTSENGTCGKNFIILIGNTWPNQEKDTNTSAPTYPSNTSNTTLHRLGYDVAQIYPVPLTNSDKPNVRFADEWAQFLYQTDVNSAPGKQNVSMFTIDVYNASADAKQTALLKSMAKVGQASDAPTGYFAVGGDLLGLINALKDVLTQIAAVNSVFASASLPVSVSAQGTFLNQVFMGVFRPDGEARQRWNGNLKQYRFALSGGSLFLADSTGAAAVDSVNTGFIQHCATSYWTTDSGTYWQGINGTQSACTTSGNSSYSDAPDGPIVERGGAGQRLRNLGFANRNIRTCASASTCSTLVDFNTTNVTSVSSTLVNWARGQNTGDGSPDASGTVTYTTYGPGLTSADTRPSVHGEVIHSRPLALNYGTSGTDDVIVFYGAGDGMLHAVNGNQTGSTAGNELWAFIAPEHWSALDRVRTDSPLIAYPNVSTTLTPTPTPKTYFFDGSIGAYQERTSSSVTHVWIYPTMRRGGNLVHAFNVTSKPSTSSQPTLLWKFGCATAATTCATGATGESNIGESWSTPVPIRVQGHTAPLVVFGAGYHTCEDSEDPNTACASVTQGRGIYVLNAQTGTSPSTDYRFIDPGSTAGRFIADMTVVDINGDGYVDVIYAVDTRGNIWRINTSNPANSFNGYTNGVSDWPINKIATVGQWGASTSERRKFMYAPSVVVLGTQTTILIGTGDREKPSSTSNAAQVVNRFYGIRDNVTVTTAADITPVVGYGTPTELTNVTGVTSIDPTALAAKGWYMNLVETTAPFEQVVTTPLTIGGVTYFSTFQAKSDSSDANTCTNLGTAFGYQVDFQTGTRVGSLPIRTTFVSEGMPPSPVGGLVSIDGNNVPFCIGCPNPSPIAPNKIVPKVKPDRKPIYRYQRIDS